MITISAMYKASGGCTPFKTCEQCMEFQIIKKGKYHACRSYNRMKDELYQLWKPSWVACKFFREQEEPSQKAAHGKKPVRKATQTNLRAKTGRKKSLAEKTESDSMVQPDESTAIHPSESKNQCEGQLSFL